MAKKYIFIFFLFFISFSLFAQKPENYKGFIKDDIPVNILIEKDPSNKFILKVGILNAKGFMEFRGEKKKTTSGKTAYYFENKKEKT
ncbi:MAG: hypothetical protein EAZ20_01325, partial [Bacteroidetes bacterium]